MLAAVQSRYGAPSALELRTVERPVAGAGEVLVKVSAASVNPADYFIVTGRPRVLQLVMGRPAPRVAIRGTDVAGIVESVGAGVTRVSPGDRVFGWGKGSFADYLVTAEDNLTLIPEGVDFVGAASLPMAGAVALQALRDRTPVAPGTRVLINGASGGIGSLAVQVAKSLGAHVTAVCSGRNVELVRSLGADRVIDYTVDDFTTLPDRYDVVLDNVSRHSLRSLRRVLTPTGALIPNGGSIGGPTFGSLGYLARATIMSVFIRQRFVTFTSTVRQQDLLDLAAMLEAGTLRPVIDTVYPLTEVAAALDHVGAGHARGKVLVTP